MAWEDEIDYHTGVLSTNLEKPMVTHWQVSPK